MGRWRGGEVGRWGGGEVGRRWGDEQDEGRVNTLSLFEMNSTFKLKSNLEEPSAHTSLRRISAVSSSISQHTIMAPAWLNWAIPVDTLSFLLQKKKEKEGKRRTKKKEYKIRKLSSYVVLYILEFLFSILFYYEIYFLVRHL